MADVAASASMVPAPLPPSHNFEVGDVVLAFHGQLLYEARILQVGAGSPAASYTVHYQGWKMSWNEVVDRAAVVIHNDDNLRYAHELLSSAKARQKQSAAAAPPAADAFRAAAEAGSGAPPARHRDEGEESDAEKRSGAAAGAAAAAAAAAAAGEASGEHAPGDRAKETAVVGLFHMPAVLKRAAVDDYLFVAKDSRLVPLPRKPSVHQVLNDWEADCLRGNSGRNPRAVREVITSLLEYFDALLPTMLLYQFERLQFEEFFRDAEETKDGVASRPRFVYGVEHLNRLFTKLPLMLDQSRVDRPVLEGIAAEVNSLMQFIAREADAVMLQEYIPPTEKYLNTLRNHGGI